MPRGRPTATVVESESEEDETQTQTQATHTQKAAAQLSPQVIDRKVGELVQFFLIQEQKKIPVKRTDITRHVLMEKEYRAAFSEILDRAKTKLREVYGLELEELQQTSGSSKVVKYILLNKLSSEAQADFIDTSNEDPKVGFLFIILGLIFMNNGVITESILWHFLKKLGLKQDDKSHEVFGDVKKLLTTEFTRQLYLEHSRIPSSEPPAYEFRWGQRATASISKMQVLKYISEKIYKIDPSSWVSQWQEACRAEGIAPDQPMAEEVDDSD